MRRSLRLFAVACWVVFVAAGAAAGPSGDPVPVLKGDFVQGGLVVGTVLTGSVVKLDGKLVNVTRDGRFLFGFGRDARPKSTLEIVYPDGRRVLRDLEVRQRKYRIQRIDGLPPKMVTPPPELLARIEDEGAAIRAARAKYTEQADFSPHFVWPVVGRVSGVYGSQRVLNGEARQPHLGVDVAAPVGTPVKAAAAGTVTLARDDLYYTGGTVVIDHGLGLSTAYSHLSAVSVKVGQKLKQAEVIGTLGATGRVTGAHLDWRVNWFQERLDPALLVGPMPK